MKPTIIIPAVVVFITILSSLYIVDQTEQALVLQFGEPVHVEKEPGLNFKIPFVQNVVIFDKRILELNAAPNEVVIVDDEVDATTPAIRGDQGSDSKRIIVDAFVKYQITDPLKFYQTVRNEGTMIMRLNTHLDSSVREVLGGVSIAQLLTGKRSGVMNRIQQSVSEKSKNFGIRIVDVRIMRSDLPEKNSASVYKRMQARYEQVAKEYRARGAEEAQRIKSRAERDRTVLLADARKQAEITRGEGDATATKIFADAYSIDEDFFAFYRTMQAYKETLQKDDTTMILSPDNDFMKYFGDIKGRFKQ